MTTPDFFRSRLDQMIDMWRPLAVLVNRLPWTDIEASLAPLLARQARPAKRVISQDLLGVAEQEFGAGISPAGRPSLPVRLRVSLMYLKNGMNLSDEELVVRWVENVQWQFFSGMAYCAAVRRHADRPLSPPAGRRGPGAVAQGHHRMRRRHQSHQTLRVRARHRGLEPDLG